ncbi:MAG: CHAT domain-containing protein [Mariprofundales bacterium]|nr:CHAT domain-containing protein [Mariprofundales bacterium]
MVGKVTILALLSACAMHVTVPENAVIGDSSNVKKLALLEQAGPPKYPQKIEYVPTLSQATGLPTAGEKNTYRIMITPELAQAYRAYLGGHGDEALAALHDADQKATDAWMHWQISFLKAQVLIKMGLAADAEAVLSTASAYEVKASGRNWNSIALRGEARIWSGDFTGAKRDLFQIVGAIGTWELPTSYALPPENLSELILITAAQLRAYTGLAALYFLSGQYDQAIRWAQAAEIRYNAVYYVSNHPLYGAFIKSRLDESYYGRATNLTMLAAAQLAQTGDVRRSDANFDQAQRLFNAIHYTGGDVFILTLKGFSHAQRGEYDTAEPQVKAAIQLAIKHSMINYIWRIEMVLGKIYYQRGELVRAEHAFRQAQRSVDLISGALATDNAKTRFGVGKEDISYYLAKLDRKKRDYATLFEDLERGRARGFIDMLAHKTIDAGKDKPQFDAIRKLGRKIVRQRLINMTLGLDKAAGIEQEQALLHQRQALTEQLRQRNPALSSTLMVWTHSLAEVQKKLSPNEVIAYALPARDTDKMAFLFIRKGRVAIRQLNLHPPQLSKDLRNFATQIGLNVDDVAAENRGIRVISNAPASQRSSLSLSVTALQRDVDFSTLRGVKVLYVVPSGVLHTMPWGVLDTTYPIVVLPTGGWLNRVPRVMHLHENRAVVVGNPYYYGALPQLPGAEQEAKAVGEILKVQPIIGVAATEALVRQRVGKGVSLLHLASHGFFDQKHPLKSALFLSGDHGAQAITAEDLFARPIPAETVVLSACETGVGKTFAGEDSLGLLRSFYLGGTLTTLSSLWSVDDEGTRMFMQLFYRYAKQGHYGSGWLAAKQELKAKGYSPAVYAAFVLGGRNERN